MNAPLPAMSRTPTAAIAGTSRPAGRQAERVTRTAAATSIASVPRMTTSGPNAWPSLICATKTLNAPMATPAEEREAKPGWPAPFLADP